MFLKNVVSIIGREFPIVRRQMIVVARLTVDLPEIVIEEGRSCVSKARLNGFP